MPMTTASTGLSLNDLARLLAKRQREINSLTKRRSKLEKKLRALDERIHAVSGGRHTGAGSRARNDVNLLDAIEAVLKKSGKPLKVGDIMEQVLKSGYRSTSANFRGIVNQTLIKGKQFQSVERGIYGLKR